MTHTLAGAIIGFAASVLPRAFDLLTEFIDHRRELRMLRLQAELAAEYPGTRIEEAFGYGGEAEAVKAMQNAMTDQRRLLKGASRWVTDLAAAVRPGVTFLFFALYLEMVVSVQIGLLPVESFTVLWAAPMESLLSAVIGFWFGSRSVGRRHHT